MGAQGHAGREMKLVILETPYAGQVGRNITYARMCIRDCLLRGEAPIASHLLYTQPGVLRDDVPDERKHGIEAGLAWGRVAEATVVYTDLGISAGMSLGIQRATREGREVEIRTLANVTPETIYDSLPDVRVSAKDHAVLMQKAAWADHLDRNGLAEWDRFDEITKAFRAGP